MNGQTGVAITGWGIVADDLTGATDAAAGFADQGWPTCIHLTTPGGPLPGVRTDGSVHAVVSGARGVTDQVAAQQTQQAVESLLQVGPDRLFVKIDSVGRGPIAAEIRGALHAWGLRYRLPRAVVCPAFPEMGRTVIDGIIHVDQRAALQSAAAHDPVTPLKSDRLADLLGDVRNVRWEDAADDRELARIAADAIAGPASLIPVGSAGLASHIARLTQLPTAQRRSRERTEGRILVGSSSLHPSSVEQMRRLTERADGGVVTTTTPAARGVSVLEAASVYASTVAATVADGDFGALVLVGGDGALAVLRELKAARIDLHGSISPGCASGVIVGGLADGMRVVTKSGGFGGADTLTKIVDRLRDPKSTSPQTASEAHRQKEIS